MKKIYTISIMLLLPIIVLIMGGCGNLLNQTGVDEGTTTNPTVISTNPANLATSVPINSMVYATFSEPMHSATITTETYTLKQGTTEIPCTVSYTERVAVLNPISNLAINTTYNVSISTLATSVAGNTLIANKTWSFKTGTTVATGPSSVNLGTAGTFVALTKSGVSNTGSSSIVGDIGVSPVAASYITGFGLIMDSTNTFSTSSLVTGKIYASDYTPPTPAKMTTAISDMETAYTDAAGRSGPDYTELGAGNIGGLTLIPGLYMWSTDLLIPTDVTLAGGATDVWIFQISGSLTMASGVTVHLTGGAKAENVFWQSFGAVDIGTTAHLEGIVLSKTAITLATGASMNGRLLTQTAATLQSNTLVQP